MLAPAMDRDITDAAATLLTHAAAMGIKVDSPVALKAVWAAHCRDMPATLLATGLAEVLKHWTNTYCLPAPGAVWDAIELPFARMRRDLAAMERAYADTSESNLDPDDRAPTAETDKVIRDTLAVLTSHTRNKGRIL